jgi:hypothetical protein
VFSIWHLESTGTIIFCWKVTRTGTSFYPV